MIDGIGCVVKHPMSMDWELNFVCVSKQTFGESQLFSPTQQDPPLFSPTQIIDPEPMGSFIADDGRRRSARFRPSLCDASVPSSSSGQPPSSGSTENPAKKPKLTV